MKKITLSFLCLSFLFPGVVMAQDLTKELNPISSTSIIRQLDSDNWICYNYGDSNEFYWVSSSGTTTPCMTLKTDNIKITDFEILNDIVYFCGYKESSTRYAMLGHFPLSTFPNSKVEYDTLPEVATFEKMDVFSAEGQVHVVMTAKKTYSSPQNPIVQLFTIVDARENTDGSWLYYILDNTEKMLTFDDVTVTDNQVVFTARSMRDDNYKAFNTTELWFFKKPTTYGVPVFISSANISCLYNWPVGQVIIEHIGEDKFIIASKKYIDVVVSSLYNYQSYQGTCKLILDEETDTRDVLDIKYNRKQNNCDVLVWNPQSETWISRIFTIQILNHYYTTGTVAMRMFKDQSIQSIDCLPSAPNYFVASGHNNYRFKLNVCKYNQPNTGNCFYMYSVPSTRVTYRWRDITKEIAVTIYQRPMQELPANPYNPVSKTICN